MQVKSIYRRLKWKLLRLWLTLIHQVRFSMIKKEQKVIFCRLAKKFQKNYDELKVRDKSDFITPMWSQYNNELEKIFLPQPPFGFLKNKTLKMLMFADRGGLCLSRQMALLENHLNSDLLRMYLEEEYVGCPSICNQKYHTSHNSIHHLYHLVYYNSVTKFCVSDYKSIIEWGGGYGNMAKIIKRMNKEITYTIIDTPLMSCLQWLFLSSILGEGEVNLLSNEEAYIVDGKVNILPINLMRNDMDIKTDVFIATWSLSESSIFAQNYVDKKNFFNARRLLIAFQKSNQFLPDAARISNIAAKRGAIIEEIDFLSDNYYAFL